MNDRVEHFQREFLRILEIRSRHIVEALNDKEKTEEQKYLGIRNRLIYDTGHLNKLSRAIEEYSKEQAENKEIVKALENLMYRLDEHSYFDKTELE